MVFEYITACSSSIWLDVWQVLASMFRKSIVKRKVFHLIFVWSIDPSQVHSHHFIILLGHLLTSVLTFYLGEPVFSRSFLIPRSHSGKFVFSGRVLLRRSRTLSIFPPSFVGESSSCSIPFRPLFVHFFVFFLLFQGVTELIFDVSFANHSCSLFYLLICLS